MKLEWKPIPDTPGYSVSNTGLVRSEHRVLMMKNGVQKTVTQKILSPFSAGSGYLMVHLGNAKREYIHRLVALAFIGEPPCGTEVNHKDENKHNNRVDNLEYLTRSQNRRYGTRNERCRTKSMEQAKPIVALKNGVVVHSFPSIHEAGRAGFCRNNISACCQGKQKAHKGYEWAYADPRTEQKGAIEHD